MAQSPETISSQVDKALKKTQLQGLARITALTAVTPILEEAQASILAYERLVDRCWAVVRAGLEPDAYRDGKWDLDQAIAHRLEAHHGQG